MNLDISLNSRAENLGIEDYKRITEEYFRITEEK